MSSPDFIADDAFQPDQAPPPTLQNQAQRGNADFIPDSQFQSDEDKYGTPGQQLLTAGEGLASGFLSRPVVSGAEELLSKAGVPNVSAQARMGRQAANPWSFGVPEAVGFGAGALTGTGEAAALGKVGELASAGAEAIGIGGKAASTISNIASAGIKTGAEMAALQTADETSKLINQDPNQSLGSAAANISLSGIIGAIGGAGLGAVSPLFKASVEKMGLPKMADDAKAEWSFRDNLKNGADAPTTLQTELNSRLDEMDNVHKNWDNLNAKALEPAMPEATESNAEKIDSQLQNISDVMTTKLEKAAESVKTKSAVPYIAEDLNNFLETATNPDATFSEKFVATNDLKRTLERYSNWGITEEGSAKANLGRDLSNIIRPMLEDESVWGDAGRIQKQSNDAISSFLKSQKVAPSKFTTKTANGLEASQDKISTLINQSLKGKGIDKADAIYEYIKRSDAVADQINQIHSDYGMEAPIRLTPTPALDYIVGTKASPGRTLGAWLHEKGLASLAGHVGGEALGAGVGTLVGHPVFGALAGDRVFGPAITAIAKPLLEKASNSVALKATVDYVGNVMKGQRLMSTAAENLFKAGAQVVPQHLIPDAASRDDLEKSLEYASNQNNAMNIGGSLGHYLPSHSTAAAAAASSAVNYLKTLKPTQPKGAPLDKPVPADSFKQYQYNNALDIAQQPLMIMDKVKEGKLQPQDLATVNAIYPGLKDKMSSLAYQEMTNAVAKGQQISSKQRQSLSLLMGQPLDSTLSQPTMMSIMMANAPKNAPQQPGAPKAPRAPKATSASMEKMNSMYFTPGQARAAHRLGG